MKNNLIKYYKGGHNYQQQLFQVYQNLHTYKSPINQTKFTDNTYENINLSETQKDFAKGQELGKGHSVNKSIRNEEECRSTYQEDLIDNIVKDIQQKRSQDVKYKSKDRPIRLVQKDMMEIQEEKAINSSLKALDMPKTFYSQYNNKKLN